MAHKRTPNLYLFLAIFLLLCGCSSVSFTADSRPQSASTSGDKVVDPASGASTDISLLDEETLINAAQPVVEEFLSGNQIPYRLGLFDVNEDGTPEVMVQDYAGWASECILYDLTDPEPVESAIRLNWPAIRVDAVYMQRSEAGVKWRIEGDDSHGFTDRTRDEIFEIENGEVKTIDCELTCILGDEKGPCSLSVGTVINEEEMESLNFSLEGIPEDKIDELLAGSLYQSYLQQDWEKLDSPPWVLEEKTAIGPDRLETRIQTLYSEWSTSR